MPFSQFNYLAPTELAAFIHTMSGVTDQALAAQFISDAEYVVDAYVGGAPKFYSDLALEAKATVTSGSTTLQSRTFGNRRPNYWAVGGLYVEVREVAGDPSSALHGQKRLVVASQNEQVTLASGFGADLPSGSTLWMRQESQFPRLWDSDPLVHPRLPEEVKRAVAYQVEYGILFGSEAFGLGDSSVATDAAGQVQSRTYGSGYSESRVPGEKRGLSVWIAPKARMILRGLLNATGHLR